MSNLFQRFAGGSEEAFNAYYQKYHKGVYASLCRLCRDETLAKDLTQEVFRNMWHRRAEFSNEEHLVNNLFFMAHAYFQQHQRSRRIAGRAEEELRRTAEPVDASAELILVTEQVFATVENAMMKLPPQQKMVMELLLLRGLDVRAVASRMQLAPQTIRNHKTQALHFLRNELYGRDLSLVVLMIILVLCFYEL